ncbi:DNA helicase UvrD [Candidatus Woesearchaeota archaeon]|nr:DNA helicase UvrD [Candidatus Woesearchaeota archaeon]
MEFISDLHLHSKYSRACSKELTIPNIEKYAKLKGINLMGTGDFQHPKWQEELKEHLEEDDTGILKTNSGFPFMLTSEISLIYSQGGKGRKVHNVIWAKSLEICEQVSDVLLKHGRIDYDGRPIFGMNCPEFVDLMKGVDESIEIIPAHIWTPWFSMFGSNSGFDTVKEAFGERANKIHALETGLSSDPEMNWRLSQLDDFSLVSFSDSHSYWPWRLGREATVFELEELTYDNVIKAIRTREGLKETIEVDPGYGKYHYDGHRNCNISLSPIESNKLNKMCPRCGRPLTIGVENRVEELADRPMGYKPENAVPFRKLIPLSELISTVTGKAVATKSVWSEYYKLVGKLGSEYDILRKTPAEDIEKHVGKKLADFIMKNRNQEIKVIPGYDGVYGVPQLGDAPAEEREPMEFKYKDKQTGLKEFL